MQNLFGCIFSFQKNVHKFGQVFRKIKNCNSKYLNGLQESGNQAHEISHVSIMLALLIISFELLQTLLKKPSSFWFPFGLHKHLLEWNTVRIPYCVHTLEIFIPCSPAPYSASQSSITLIYVLIHPPLYWNILKITKFWCTAPCLHHQHIILPFFFITVCSRRISEGSNCTWKSTKG